MIYLKIHLFELLAPLHKECGTNIEMKLRERVCSLRLIETMNLAEAFGQMTKAITNQIRVPHADCILDTDFTH
jgi:hypothetical protein